MKPMSEQEEKEYKEMTVTFIGLLTKAYEYGILNGLTDHQIREENPILFDAMDKIERISTKPLN